VDILSLYISYITVTVQLLEAVASTTEATTEVTSEASTAGTSQETTVEKSTIQQSTTGKPHFHSRIHL
jgi:hypothetical protein